MSASEQIWVPQVSGTKKSLKSVAWTGKELVVSGYSFGGGIFLVSHDGTNWRTIETNDAAAAFSLVWTGDKIVAAGATAGRGCIILSDDLKEWNYIKLAHREIFTSLIWTGERLFTGGPDGWLLSSEDGGYWETVGFVPINIQSIAFTGIMFVVARDEIQTSFSGKTGSWTTQKINGNLIETIEFVKDNASVSDNHILNACPYRRLQIMFAAKFVFGPPRSIW